MIVTPTMHASLLTVALPASERASVAPQARAPAQPSLGTGTALLVDDEPEVRRVASRMLERLGFDVIEASHGKEAEALTRLRHDEISLVVLDVIMPEMDGLQAREAIRSLCPSVPIILMSGNPVGNAYVNDDRSRFLMKPFTYQELSAAIEGQNST